MRTWKSYQKNNRDDLTGPLLHIARQFEHFQFLNSCGNTVYGKNKFDYLLAIGNYRHIETNAGDAFEQLKHFLDEHQDWCFGYFGYDLKNEIENLTSEHPDHIGFSDMVFFIPEIIIAVDEQIHIGTRHYQHDVFYEQILSAPGVIKNVHTPVVLRERISKDEYIDKVTSIRNHIVEGDIYEMNLCQEFFADDAVIDPYAIFSELCNFSKAPFSVLFRWGDRYLISASPERFMKKTGDTIFSQPMKGTIQRDADPAKDILLKQQLSASEKDRAENVMIVDLVRNDLAKSCRTGTIQVDELFAIYSFEHVHQMVSTVSGELNKETHPVDAIKNAFPMGSMTGAPKVMAMALIEQYETTRRGLFSGSMGYFMPEKNGRGYDFDFNVIIRSILYQASEKYISAQVGGAIVYDSVPEDEYRECLTKLGALEQILNGSHV